MRHCSLLAAIWAVGFAVWANSAMAQQAPPPVEAFGRLPQVADAAISPDGSKVALAMGIGDDAVINVVDLNTGARLFGGVLDENSQLRSVGWASDDLVSYVVSRTFHPGQVLPWYMRFEGRPRRVDYLRNGVVELESQRTHMLTINRDDPWADQGAYLVAPIEGETTHALMIGRAPGVSSRHPTVYRVGLSGGRARLAGVRGVNEDTVAYVIDERGRTVVRADSNARTNHWQVFAYDGDTPRLLLEGDSETGAPIDLEGLMPDGRLAVVDIDEAAGYHALIAINLNDGARETVFAREDADVSGAIVDPWTRRVVGVHWPGGRQYFDPVLEESANRVSAQFEGGAAWLESWSRDRSKLLIYGELGLDGGEYYIYTTATDEIARLAARYPELANTDLGVRQEITYPARDGTRVQAYLTLPTGAAGENLPLVVLVHGGPHGVRDTINFDWWSTFLASRGYAVLQANYRGSGGYGEAWERAGYGEWGGLMQTDVEDGVVALAQIGLIDAERVCIVGASYGGYAALAGATLTPDRYTCAASIAGVSDLERMLRQEEAESGADSPTVDFWRRTIGDRRLDQERIRAVSPARLAEHVQVPILLMHGTDDTVVPITQSRVMLDRLRDARKDVRFVELQGDDHWLSDARTRILMLRELETFLAENIGAN